MYIQLQHSWELSFSMKQCRDVAVISGMMLWWLQITNGKWMTSMTKKTRVTCHHWITMSQDLLVGDIHPLVNWCEELLSNIFSWQKVKFFLTQKVLVYCLISWQYETTPKYHRASSRMWALIFVHKEMWKAQLVLAHMKMRRNHNALFGNQSCGEDRCIAHLETAAFIPWSEPSWTWKYLELNFFSQLPWTQAAADVVAQTVWGATRL